MPVAILAAGIFQLQGATKMQAASKASEHQTGPKSGPPAWVAYSLMALLCISASLVTGLAPYFSPPLVDRPMGVVFLPLSNGTNNLARLIEADPELAIVDSWYSERVIFIVTSDPDFSRKLTGIGAIHAFDAIAAGCHITDQAV